MAKVKKKSKKKFFIKLTLFNYVISIITLLILFWLNVIPNFYFIGLVVIVCFINILITCLLLGKGWKKRFFGTILTFLEIVAFIFINLYAINTLDFLHKIDNNDYNTENYSVIVLKNSDYDHVKDLKNKTIGVLNDNDEGIIKARNKVSKKVDVTFQEFDDLTDLDTEFLKGNVDAILIEESEIKILEEENERFLNQEKIIYQFSIDIKINDTLSKKVDIAKTPFNLFISGIDTYGKITSVSRSDVNMVITINPSTHKILMTSIPRDYYVTLHGINTTYKDKLTHAGIHGIDTSVKTVEDLLSTEINYYGKVNFTSLVSIVDTLGGISVLNDKEFRAYYIEDEVIDYTFKEGTINLNGRQALAYSRERKSLALGDIERAKHQQQVLQAIIEKAMSKQIILKYNVIINGLEDKVTTNVGTKNITKFIKNQIKNPVEWEIDSYTLSGTSDYNYTNSYKNAQSYVMIPDEDSIEEAKEKINSVLEK